MFKPTGASLCGLPCSPCASVGFLQVIQLPPKEMHEG